MFLFGQDLVQSLKNIIKNGITQSRRKEKYYVKKN